MSKKTKISKGWLNQYAEGGMLEEPVTEPGKESKPPKKSGISKELLVRQQFKESSFNPKAKSGANAKGLAQIMDEVEKDARKAGVLKKGEDIYDPKVNTRVQKWYMDDLYNSSFINKPGQKEDVKIAKALAAYNYGRGNVLKHLNEKKAAGVDIYNSFDWLEGLPAETTDYVNKILLKKDPGFEKEYIKASKNYKYDKGGKINLTTPDGEKHLVYIKESPTGVGKGVEGHVMVNHPTKDKGKWDTIDLTEKAGAKTVADGKKATLKWHKENPMDDSDEYAKGGLIKRADGSYSKRGLWDNIRANRGSGRKPTKEMLEQERKIKAEYKKGGNIEDGKELRIVRHKGTSYYDPVEDIVYLNTDANIGDAEYLHELYHKQQRDTGRLRFPKADPYGVARRQPSMLEEQEQVDYPYYNRRQVDADIITRDFLANNYFPDYMMASPNVLYNRVTEPNMYNLPFAEGEAVAAETPEGRAYLQRKGIGPIYKLGGFLGEYASLGTSYLEESNKSKQLDKLALNKARQTPYNKGGWLNNYK